MRVGVVVIPLLLALVVATYGSGGMVSSFGKGAHTATAHGCFLTVHGPRGTTFAIRDEETSYYVGSRERRNGRYQLPPGDYFVEWSDSRNDGGNHITECKP